MLSLTWVMYAMISFLLIFLCSIMLECDGCSRCSGLAIGIMLGKVGKAGGSVIGDYRIIGALFLSLSYII